MFTVGLDHYIILSAVLFCIGLLGVLTQRNVIKVIMCLEIMLNAVNIALIAFSQYITPVHTDRPDIRHLCDGSCRGRSCSRHCNSLRCLPQQGKRRHGKFQYFEMVTICGYR